MNIPTNPKKLRGFERYVKVDNVSRRSILKGLGLAGGFVLAAPVMSRPGFAAYQTGADKMPHGTVVDPRVFVAIAPDGIVTIVAHRAEMGTGVRTSLPMIVAEEMEADWSRVRIQQAHGDEVKFGNQDTDGSRSTRHYLIPMRQIGASARTMLEQDAAKRWGVPASEVKAANHEVVHSASGRKLGFGELAADAAKQSVPSVEGLKLKDPKDFRYLGKGEIGIVDLHDITTGAARYGADVRLPGMKYAVIARPPVTGGKVVSFDGSEAMKVSGVEKVMEVRGWPWPSKFQPLGGVAVIARNTGAAIKGRDALKIVWDDGANGKYDSVAYRAELEEAARKPGLVVRKEGDVDAYAELVLPFRQALSILATVISAWPSHAVLNCGLKALGMDHGNPTMEDGHHVWFVSDEHITFSSATRVKVGDRLRVLPAHVDPTVAYHERMFVVDGHAVVDEWPVDLRGW